jgi:transcriptional regulator with XRE-family HTH domain
LMLRQPMMTINTGAESGLFAFMRERVRQRGINQKQIADAADIRPTTVSMLLNGNVQRIDVNTLARLAPVLGVSFETLCRLAVGLPEPDSATESGQVAHLSDRALAVAARFDQLPEEQRRGIELILGSGGPQ